ncbi:MAG: efflux RND transporter periplasmic adaptor subunit [Marinifilaceae bacterium]
MKSKNIIVIILVLFTGIFAGWFLFKPAPKEDVEHEHVHEKQKTIWTCSMHPQIKMDKKGKCPICAMDLIPLDTESSSSEMDDETIQISEAAAKLADIQTLIIRKEIPVKKIYLQGKIKADERLVTDISTRFSGRIEKLFVNFTGQVVRKGELLAKIYSPELISAQKELIEASKYKKENPAIYRAARGKLKLWSISDKQIKEIERKNEVEEFFNIVAPSGGTVSMRMTSNGDFVKKGESIFKLVDLRKLWVIFYAYETDLAWIHMGDSIKFEIAALTGEEFMGKISYIDPFINDKTRTTQIRLEINNKKKNIKPQMFVKGMLESTLASNRKEIVVPKSSVLWTGKKAIVYVKNPKMKSPSFSYREVILGSSTGSAYIIKKGLQEGEEIVVNGVFKIDAAAQLKGSTSMMKPAHKNSIINKDFSKELLMFYNAYLKLKDAFISSDSNEITKTTISLNNIYKSIDMKLLDKKDHKKWMKESKILNLSISKIVNSKELHSQREAFAILSKSLFEVIKYYKISQESYYHFCPMADDNKGAYWLSDSKKVRNPYFGDEMLECGELKTIIK